MTEPGSGLDWGKKKKSIHQSFIYIKYCTVFHGSMRQLFPPTERDSRYSDLSAPMKGMYKTPSDPNLARQSLWK
jgi:hypothetical protein